MRRISNACIYFIWYYITINWSLWILRRKKEAFVLLLYPDRRKKERRKEGKKRKKKQKRMTVASGSECSEHQTCINNIAYMPLGVVLSPYAVEWKMSSSCYSFSQATRTQWNSGYIKPKRKRKRKLITQQTK